MFDRLSQFITVLYLFTLALTCGVILALGALSAPVIFHASEYLTDGTVLDTFQSGLIMTEIFVRSSDLLLFVAIFIAIYEIFFYSISSVSKKRFIVFGMMTIISISLFALYYIPAIVEMQQMGSESLLSNASFDDLHRQSVWVFNVALWSLIALFSSRVMLLMTFRH